MVIPDLFSHFESLSSTGKTFPVPKLGIISYGMSMTTLEEVFLKLEEEEDKGNNKTSELEKNEVLTNNALLIADETDIDGSINDL